VEAPTLLVPGRLTAPAARRQRRSGIGLNCWLSGRSDPVVSGPGHNGDQVKVRLVWLSVPL
jgi:hypothetical protein